MAPEDRDRLRAQQVRVFAIGAVVWVVLAGMFAIIDYTTTLNGWAGMMAGVLIAPLLAVVAVALRRKQSQKR